MLSSKKYVHKKSKGKTKWLSLGVVSHGFFTQQSFKKTHGVVFYKVFSQGCDVELILSLGTHYVEEWRQKLVAHSSKVQHNEK